MYQNIEIRNSLKDCLEILPSKNISIIFTNCLIAEGNKRNVRAKISILLRSSFQNNSCCVCILLFRKRLYILIINETFCFSVFTALMTKPIFLIKHCIHINDKVLDQGYMELKSQKYHYGLIYENNIKSKQNHSSVYE